MLVEMLGVLSRKKSDDGGETSHRRYAQGHFSHVNVACNQSSLGRLNSTIWLMGMNFYTESLLQIGYNL